MLKKLSKKQMVVMEKIKKKWNDRIFTNGQKQIDQEQIIKGVHDLYDLCQLPHPEVVICDSMLGMVHAKELIKNKQGFSVQNSVGESVRDYVRRSAYDSVRKSVCDSVYDPVWRSVFESARGSVYEMS